QRIFWKVRIWDKNGAPCIWSGPASWSMGLLKPEDWKARWISFKDMSPVHNDRNHLFLPPAHHYRKEFQAAKQVKRATIHASALGLFELYLNGQRVGDNYFEPGWSDYHKRAYYRTHDVTALVRQGGNAIGAIVADGWYSGYVGYGLLVGYGPNKAGRNFYGKTPALLVQLEIEYTDGSREVIGTDSTWKVTDHGPICEADLIMGESYDARAELGDWASLGFKDDLWENAIRAEDNGSTKATFSDTMGDREVELGFQRPLKMQAYAAPPIRVAQELSVQRITEPKPGVYIFDLGQNFAGVIRLKVKGPSGTKVRMRYGEMLHPDGSLMTENLRRARATDYYTLRGDAKGEVWSPRFTYHGFQFVELTGLPSRPGIETVTGLVLQNDTPGAGSFECSDEVLTKFAENARWTQRANFMEVPTDCPQRDERLGWMGDAQTYIRTASFNADVAAFFTKWLDDVEEAQRDFGAYPDYCPYPMSHGAPGKSFGTAWTDAGVICPWTIWKVYGDTRVIDRHWASLTRFMDWRAANTTPDGLGVSIGNTWGDWLNVNEATPVEYIDTCYHALTCKLMVDMAEATSRKEEAAKFRARFDMIKAAFNKAYVIGGGRLKVDTQTAYVLALWIGLLPEDMAFKAAETLGQKIAKNGNRMATGFLGTRPLLPALSANGQHDLAVRLFQSRQFPSWGYEVINGANSVWERWDSYTKEHGFDGKDGKQNAAMNSFSHYSFGAVMEWAYRNLAGIDTDGAGYQRIIIQPGPPSAGSNPDNKPVDWVKAEYTSARGKIAVAWKLHDGSFYLNAAIPANTTATVFVPAKSADDVSEGGKLIDRVNGVKFLRREGARVVLAVESGSYQFVSHIVR
ncbi:MAG TPA: family 78 glycoside hydrolase catalytic domain, partial [Verrucomicrobiae bacterium]|nr:family 78 glycoside hydrolase catalytic domain [Verrucomicrobiae bacterium]